MDKRRSGSRGRTCRSDDHDEHDGRGCVRQVRFKPVVNSKKDAKAHRQVWCDKLMLMDDDEVDKLPIAPEQPVCGGFPKRPRKFMPGPSAWYQIVIPHGSKHNKDVLMTAIESILEAEDAFIPISFRFNHGAAVLYVDDAKIAQKLFNADRKVKFPNGCPMMLRVRNLTPVVKLTDSLKEQMKTVMAKRYNHATKALDLTRFHIDVDLRDTMCPLATSMVLQAAIEIIQQNVPDLEELNLNENHLITLRHLEVVLPKLKQLKILYLADNGIPSGEALMPLKVLPLVELSVKGNPLVDNFMEHDSYVRECSFNRVSRSVCRYVQKHFPKLRKLDEAELPPAGGYDVAEGVSLPPRQPYFLVEPQGVEVVRLFLTQFFTVYDSESRQPLLAAYHENATMSLCTNYTHDVRSSRAPSEGLTRYMGQNNRNMLLQKGREAEERKSGLHEGSLQVVSFLSELPATQHDLSGSSIDLMVYTPHLIVLTINGVFRETSSPHSPEPLRSFHRTLIIVPANDGFCIRNDMLFVTNATEEQKAKAFQDAAPVAAPAPAPAPAVIVAPEVEHLKTQLVMLLAQQTGMNAYWSTECLQSCDWYYQRALLQFAEFHGQGRIPPEAFGQNAIQKISAIVEEPMD